MSRKFLYVSVLCLPLALAKYALIDDFARQCHDFCRETHPDFEAPKDTTQGDDNLLPEPMTYGGSAASFYRCLTQCAVADVTKPQSAASIKKLGITLGSVRDEGLDTSKAFE